ncbi:MAG: purine-binding chemotaxis protein CheW [Gammaproteobacteria bacterium]|nr:purine-binding chemotaxis protein CheW [Gammaproteobacteria bacterium]
MSSAASRDPLAVLADIEQRCRISAAGLPQQAEVKEQWLGIGFRLAETRLVTPLGEVVEILTVPETTRVPGTRHWVLGLANVRGNLLPVLDLMGYLGGGGIAAGRDARVLVVHHGDVFAGLMVDEVLGLHHFYEEARSAQRPDVDTALQPYITGAFASENGTRPVFSMHRLVETGAFMQVAV